MPERLRGPLVALALALPFVVGYAAHAATGDGADVVLTFADPEVLESSGLVVTDGLVVTTNDSGDTGRVFAVGPEGRTVGVTTWSDSPVDVEALAPAGPGQVWVGDIGDNAAARDSVSVARVPVGRGPIDAGAEAAGATYELVYPGGARDAETLVAHPRTGRLYVASKSFFGGTLYEAPARLDPDRPNELREVGGVLPIATDGAFFPDGRHLVVRDYGRAEVYAWPSLRSVGELDLPDQQQGEGIAVTGDGRVLVSTEGQFSDVLEVPLPADLQEALAPAPSEPTGTATAPAAPDTEVAPPAPADEGLRTVPLSWLLGALTAILLAGWLLVRAVRRAGDGGRTRR
ncbi:hypothetical protein [Nocardioides dokdonensis]|uniref:hypothetical protein n=1 Tax=Nocardioides dokdonensis TaxID=450734 RepID=UPI0012F982F6|nr:hypothetical protein [Nocardioides dokdonensis]